MVNEELRAIVDEVYYKQKKSKEDVKKALLSEGWKEEDIKDEDIQQAVVEIRNQALRKLPVFKSIYGFFDVLEEKYAHLSTRAVIFILLGVAFWLFLVAFAVYLVYDPTSMKAGPAPVQQQQSSPSEGDVSFP